MTTNANQQFNPAFDAEVKLHNKYFDYLSKGADQRLVTTDQLNHAAGISAKFCSEVAKDDPDRDKVNRLLSQFIEHVSAVLPTNGQPPAPVPGSPTITPAPAPIATPTGGTAPTPITPASPSSPPAPVPPANPWAPAPAPVGADNSDLLRQFGTLLDEKIVPVAQQTAKNADDIGALKASVINMKSDMEDVKSDVAKLKAAKDSNPVIGGIAGIVALFIALLVLIIWAPVEWYLALVIASVFGMAVGYFASKFAPRRKTRKARKSRDDADDNDADNDSRR